MGNDRKEHADRAQLVSEYKVNGNEIDSNEVDGNEIKKNQKMFKSKKFFKSKKTVGSSDIFTP